MRSLNRPGKSCNRSMRSFPRSTTSFTTRSCELNDSYNAITHVLNSTRIAIVFLDTELKVKRFTKEAAVLINLIDTDVGRPIDHIAHNLYFDNLAQKTREVSAKFFELRGGGADKSRQLVPDGDHGAPHR
jgi:hypothetical protein